MRSVMIFIYKLGCRQRAEDGSRVLFQYLRREEGSDGCGGLEQREKPVDGGHRGDGPGEGEKHFYLTRIFLFLL